MFFVFSLSTWREPAPFDLKDERFKGKKLQRKDVVVTRAKIQTTNRENQNESEMCTDRLNATTSEHASHGLKRLDTEKGNESLCFFFFFFNQQREDNYVFLFNNFCLLRKSLRKEGIPETRDLLGTTMIVIDEVYIMLYIHIYIFYICIYIISSQHLNLL